LRCGTGYFRDLPAQGTRGADEGVARDRENNNAQMRCLEICRCVVES